MKTNLLLTLKAAKRLSLFALVMLSLCSLLFISLKERIAAQRQSTLLAQFLTITPHVMLDESFLNGAQEIELPSLKAIHYHAPSGEHYLVSSTMQGYSGEIRMMVALNEDKTTILGVRVLEHKETPGLGDKIDPRISDWIFSFNGATLNNKRFDVKKDGGDFDAFTGATITPRAIVRHVGTILREFPQSALPNPKQEQP
ncbi:MAG: RnfABCDGE type electron transport complex subunit G [Cardiobacteriaceae bacterium]|nr:RnfABCDGE type electron transport complex subunit G [Cardiobacteriaceae bacterium]